MTELLSLLKLRRSIVILAIIYLLGNPSLVRAASPSNVGLTGLWEYPTAEVLDDGTGWFGYSDTYPLSQLYATLGYLPNFEINLRATNFLNGPIISPGFGHYKDKSFDVKYRLKEQEGIYPSVAAGIIDFSGTELLRSYFAVGTYRFDNIAVSLGWGSDWLGGVFAGIEWQPYPWLTLKAERGSIDYDQYPFRDYEKIIKDSDYNYGAIISTPWNVDLNVSYQRGEELCLGVRYNFDLTKPVFDGHKDRLKGLPIHDLPSWNEIDAKSMATEIANKLAKELPIKDIQVFVDERKLLITYENKGYSSEAEAMGRVLYLASHMIPWDVESVSLVPKVRGIAASRIDIPGDHCALLRLNELRKEYSVESHAYWVNPDDESDALNGEKWAFSAVPSEKTDAGIEHVFKVMPVYEIQALRWDQDYYMDRTSLDFIYEWNPSYLENPKRKGSAAVVDIRMPLYNDIELRYQPQLNDDTRIWKTVYSIMRKIDTNTFELGEIGWLDEMWFGMNYSRRTYFQNGRWWAGFKAGIIHERDPYSFGSLSDYKINTYYPYYREYPHSEYEDDNGWWTIGLLQVGYRFAELDFEVNLDAGLYADGHSGGTMTFMRHWDDLGIGFWALITPNTPEGKDFSNSGIYLEIPFDAWTGTRSKHIWRQKARIQASFDFYGGREADWWQGPDQLWGQLNPDRLLNNLYKELEQGQNMAKEMKYSMQEGGNTYVP